MISIIINILKKINKQKIEKVSRWYSSKKGLNAYMIDCVYKTIKEYIKQYKILEIGPADGKMTTLLINDFKKLTVIEPSVYYAQILNKKYSNKILVYNDCLEKINIKSKFDTIIASHVLEHVENVEPFLLKVKELLDKEGVFIVSVPNALSVHRLIGVELGLLSYPHQLNRQDIKIGHYRVYDIESLKSDVKRAGFNIISSFGSYIKFLSNSQHEKYIPKKMWKNFYKISGKFPNNCADIILVCKKNY